MQYIVQLVNLMFLAIFDIQLHHKYYKSLFKCPAFLFMASKTFVLQAWQGEQYPICSSNTAAHLCAGPECKSVRQSTNQFLHQHGCIPGSALVHEGRLKQHETSRIPLNSQYEPKTKSYLTTDNPQNICKRVTMVRKAVEALQLQCITTTYQWQPHSQAFNTVQFFILQAIKNWSWGSPGNKVVATRLILL